MKKINEVIVTIPIWMTSAQFRTDFKTTDKTFRTQIRLTESVNWPRMFGKMTTIQNQLHQSVKKVFVIGEWIVFGVDHMLAYLFPSMKLVSRWTGFRNNNNIINKIVAREKRFKLLYNERPPGRWATVRHQIALRKIRFCANCCCCRRFFHNGPFIMIGPDKMVPA